MTDRCHTFVYHSVTQPSHCPRCGQCLHPAHTQPWPPYQPWPYMQPYQPYRPTSWPGLPGTWMKVTSTTHTNTAGDPAMRV
jgi:hypothetical protein